MQPQFPNCRRNSGGKLAFLDHVQIATHNVQQAYEWYTDIGFRLTEYTATDGTEELWGVWLKRKNNTQDVVYANGPEAPQPSVEGALAYDFKISPNGALTINGTPLLPPQPQQ